MYGPDTTPSCREVPLSVRKTAKVNRVHRTQPCLFSWRHAVPFYQRDSRIRCTIVVILRLKTTLLSDCLINSKPLSITTSAATSTTPTMFTRKKAADMALATSSHHNEDDLLGESSDLDFDSVTESGRAIAHLVALMENTNDDMDFSISSGRSGDGNAPESSHSNYPSDPDHMKSRTTTTNAAAAVRPTQVRSPAKAIPKQTNPVALPQSSGASLQHPENSAGSTGSSFLSGIFNPVGSTVGGLQLSHTPPTLLSTSYESAHFGKRLRSGVSDCHASSIVVCQMDGRMVYQYTCFFCCCSILFL